MSIIAAGTTTTTALSSTGNTDGTLQFQVNGTTPSVTLNTLGAIGVGSTPGYGTSGQVLTSGGSTVAPTWATPATTSPAGSTGQVQYNNAGAFGAVSSGTSGQVLTSAGSGAAPTWSTPSSGAMTLISTTVASSSSSVVFTGLSSSYKNYVVMLDDVFPASDQRFGLQVSTNGGSTWITSDYAYTTAQSNIDLTGTFSPGVNVQAGYGETVGRLLYPQQTSNTVYSGISGVINLFNPSNASNRKSITFDLAAESVNNSTPYNNFYRLAGSILVFNTTNAYNAVRFQFDGGVNIASGTFKLYGIS